MSNIFQLLETGVEFTWDPEELTKNFKVFSNNTGDTISLQGEAYWQYYISGIYFTRNFTKSFPKICEEVVDILSQVQNKLRISDTKFQLVDLFLNHKFIIDNVLLIKIASGTSVDLHFDRTRPYAVNIGLKNSNTCLTHVYSGEVVKDTFINEKNVKHTFQMNDGDAYLIATCQPHAVESLISNNDNADRYLISYCL